MKMKFYFLLSTFFVLTHGQWSKICNFTTKTCILRPSDSPELPTLLANIQPGYTVNLIGTFNLSNTIDIHVPNLLITGGSIIQNNINCLSFRVFADSVSFTNLQFTCLSGTNNYIIIYHRGGKVNLTQLPNFVLWGYIFGNPSSYLELTTDATTNPIVLAMQAGGTINCINCPSLRSIGTNYTADYSNFYQGLLNIDFSCSPTIIIQKKPCNSNIETLTVLFSLLIGGLGIGLIFLLISFTRIVTKKVNTITLNETTNRAGINDPKSVD